MNVGPVTVIVQRPLDGPPKTATRRRSRTGTGYVSCSGAWGAPSQWPRAGPEVGLDGGRTAVAARSTGEALAQARFFRQAQQARATAPRRLRPAARGPPERAARRTVVARVDARRLGRRGDFAQHHSRRLADAVALSAVADVPVKRMGQTHCLAQRLQDAAGGRLADLLASQAARAGRKYGSVTPGSTTQT